MSLQQTARHTISIGMACHMYIHVELDLFVGPINKYGYNDNRQQQFHLHRNFPFSTCCPTQYRVDLNVSH